MGILYRLLRGIRRRQGNSLTRSSRSPIIVAHLHTISVFLYNSGFSLQDKFMFLSFCLLAFYGLLRVSIDLDLDPEIHLLCSDILYNKDFTIMFVHIKASKTDPFRSGTTISVAALRGNLCPVQVMRMYISLSPNTQGPLFRCSSGQFLTRCTLCLVLGLALPNIPNINTHSFRIGGTSADNSN